MLCGVEGLLMAQLSWTLGEGVYHRADITQMGGHYRVGPTCETSALASLLARWHEGISW